MANVKTAAAAASEVKKTAADELAQKLADGWEYVVIPERDPYDYKFDGIWINHTHYKPGRHFVPKDVAYTLNERLEAWRAYMIRLMQSQSHRPTMAQMDKSRGGTGAQWDNTPLPAEGTTETR